MGEVVLAAEDEAFLAMDLVRQAEYARGKQQWWRLVAEGAERRLNALTKEESAALDAVVREQLGKRVAVADFVAAKDAVGTEVKKE